ncbi:MAG TPA: glycosyltransferase family 2 protein [Pyrinomonadaceae bacterium]|nr:glycosyltransferase family 2 protein [Pyrinomonadaceae bacterium]
MARREALISIVIPAFNEEGNIARLERELLTAVGPLAYDFEFIVIDNGSTDGTRDLVKALCARDTRWKYLRFSRNFTVEMSITAGYHYAAGEAIVVLYSDLQDPPEVIPRLIEKWREGFDVVYGVRTVRAGDAAWRNKAVKIAYRLIGWFSDVPIPNDAGDFRLVTRQVRDALERCPEQNRYMRGLIAWLGFRQTGVPYERQPRTAGLSKAPFTDLLFFVFNAITSFSLRPLRLFTLMGTIILALSIVAAFVYALLWFTGSPPPGVTTIIVLLLAAIGLNSIGIGILGEYVGRTYIEAKHRPLYVVQESINFSDSPSQPDSRLPEP